MDELENLIASVDFQEPGYDHLAHRNIYNLIHGLSRDIDETSESAQPPPSLIFYAVRNILYPYFIVGQIPDLLNLLTHIETYRQFAVLKSDEALEWHTYYEREQRDGREQNVRLLAANELHTLGEFLNENGARREKYIALVRSLVQMYIHYLWTAPESCLMWKRFNDFFPGSIEGIDSPSDLLFLTDLSEDEKVCFDEVKIACQEWVRRVVEWEGTRKEALEDKGVSPEGVITSFVEDFRDAFPQPFEPSLMARNIEIYMGEVENMVQTLERWFPASSAT